MTLIMGQDCIPHSIKWRGSSVRKSLFFRGIESTAISANDSSKFISETPISSSALAVLGTVLACSLASSSFSLNLSTSDVNSSLFSDDSALHVHSSSLSCKRSSQRNNDLSSSSLELDQTVPSHKSRLAVDNRNVFTNEDYAEVKRANVRSSKDGEKVDRLHVTFFLSKFSPLQRGFDGHCGVVYTLDSEMYLDNHPGVPKQLRRLKYFVAGFGSRAVPRDPFSQQSIDIWAFRSRKDAEEKALKLRDKPSAVQRLHPDAEPVRLGVVQPGSKGDEKAYVVDSHVLKPAHVYGECKEVLGKVKRNEFYSRKEAQEFADGLWKFDNPRELPLINPSKNTLLNCVRVKPRKQAEQFFSTLRNVTFLSLGTSLKSKSDRVARIRLDRRFRKSKDAWQYARNHRPGKVVVTQAALPSKLLALSSRRRLSVRECLKDAAPQKIVQALSALLPDDPYRTQVNYEYVKRLKGVWKSHRTHSGLKPWQLEALKLRLHPSAGSFSRTWRLWNKSKKRLDKYDGY